MATSADSHRPAMRVGSALFRWSLFPIFAVRDGRSNKLPSKNRLFKPYSQVHIVGGRSKKSKLWFEQQKTVVSSLQSSKIGAAKYSLPQEGQAERPAVRLPPPSPKGETGRCPNPSPCHEQIIFLISARSKCSLSPSSHVGEIYKQYEEQQTKSLPGKRRKGSI